MKSDLEIELRKYAFKGLNIILWAANDPSFENVILFFKEFTTNGIKFSFKLNEFFYLKK